MFVFFKQIRQLSLKQKKTKNENTKVGAVVFVKKQKKDARVPLGKMKPSPAGWMEKNHS